VKRLPNFPGLELWVVARGARQRSARVFPCPQANFWVRGVIPSGLLALALATRCFLTRCTKLPVAPGR